jgi:CRISPR-associated protein Cas1
MPEPLPIRMLNEHLYCPRLFHLMHVQGLWAESADTVEGRSQHERAAARAPAKPPPAGEDEQPWPARPRDLHLSDPDLGIVGKLDALEPPWPDTPDPEWTPVEAKHSAPPAPERAIVDSAGRPLAPGAWSNDQIQLCAQGLLLRANGYRSTHGLLYYRRSRQRVRIEFDAALEQATRDEVARARITEAGPMPPPLVDSPKCARCSLHSICLPDETNWLLHRLARPPARVMPGRDDAGVLYVSEPGTRVGKRSQCLVLSPPGEAPEVQIPLKDIAHVSLFGAVQCSTQLIHEAMASGRSISWLSAGGRYLGGAFPPLAKNFHVRRAQFRLMENSEACLGLARRVVTAKIMNCRTLLRRNGPKGAAELGELRRHLHAARRAASVEELMGIEGLAARSYFPAFAGLIAARGLAGLEWEGRNRRPPRDPVNAALSLAYALLVRDVEVALRNAGLEPMAGFFHSPLDGRPSLALDLMEPFRPLIAESVVLRAFNSGTLGADDFFVLPGQASLKDAARKRFFAAYEQRMSETIRHPRFTYSISYRRTLELEARLLARHLEGELPDYTPLMTR